MEYTNWYGSNPDDGGGKQAEDCVLKFTWAVSNMLVRSSVSSVSTSSKVHYVS